VERLWSLASHILTDTQTNDTNCFWVTYLFESEWKVLGPRPS
jgi:hypothetical protein